VLYKPEYKAAPDIKVIPAFPLESIRGKNLQKLEDVL
jgi:hypothetical protein